MDLTTGMRQANRADSARLCELFKSISMKADLHLTVERDPDFFALYDLQGRDQHIVAITLGEAIEGMGSFLGRDGWVGGQPTRVGYMGDLRFSERIRGGRVLGTHFPVAFREASRSLGAEVMLTAIIGTNQTALNALVKRSDKYPDKPFYAPLCQFKILSVQFLRRMRARKTPFTVRRATEADLGAVAALLREDHAKRPFGYVIDEGVLRERLRTWPGLRVEDFFLAHDGAGRLRGVSAVWDPSPVKRYRVLGYHRRMKWLRLGVNAAAKLLGGTGLPPAGDLMRYFYLTHVSVKDEDPAVMTALVDAIYAEHFGKGYHFFTAFVMDGDPLAPAYAAYTTSGLRAGLYAVSAAGSKFNQMSFGPGRPGFEMALV